MNNDLSLVLYLHDLKLSLSHLRFLQEYYQDTQDFLPPRHKLKTELEKYGYIYEDQITPKGKDLVFEANNWEEIYEPMKQAKKVERVYSKEFEAWWETMPSTDNFEIDGKLFQGIRSLRDKKPECQTKFDNLTKFVSAQELIDALKYEVDARIDQSLLRGANQLSFIKNTWSYLHNKSFEPYLELAAKGPYKRKGQEIKQEMIDTNNLF